MIEERHGNAGEPYAVKSTLGWSLVGPRALVNNVSESLGEPTIKINFLCASRQDLLDSQIQFLWRLNQVPTCDHNISLSKEDRYALRQMQQKKTVMKVTSIWNFLGDLELHISRTTTTKLECD